MVIVIIFLIQGFFVRFFSRKYYKLISLITTIVLAYLSFHIVIDESADLFRHHQQIEYYRLLGWSFAKRSGGIYRNLLTKVSYWLASFLDDNNWYQTIAVFITYSCLFTVIWNVAEDNNYDKRWLSKTTLFVTLCFSYYNAVFALRIWVVFAVYALCFYEECVRNRHKLICWILYIACFLFHYASLLLLIPRIIVPFLANEDKSVNKMLKNIGMVIVYLIVCFLFLKSKFVAIIFDKVEAYSEYTVRGTWQNINCWVRLLCVVAMSFFYKKTYAKNIFQKRYSLIIILIFFIAVIQYDNYQITLRFADALVAFSPLLVVINNQKGEEYTINKTELCMLLATIVQLLYILIFDYRLLMFVF